MSTSGVAARCAVPTAPSADMQLVTGTEHDQRVVAVKPRGSGSEIALVPCPDERCRLRRPPTRISAAPESSPILRRDGCAEQERAERGLQR